MHCHTGRLPTDNWPNCLLQECYESTYDNAAPLLDTLHQLMMQRLVPHLRSASMLQPGLLTLHCVAYVDAAPECHLNQASGLLCVPAKGKRCHHDHVLPL